MKKSRRLAANSLRAIMFLVAIQITIYNLLAMAMTIVLMQTEKNIFIEFVLFPLHAITAGYGLFSFWWLLAKFDTLSISEIPTSIKIGLFSGFVISITYLVLLKDNYFNEMHGLMFLDLSVILIVIYLFFILLFIYVWPK